MKRLRNKSKIKIKKKHKGTKSKEDKKGEGCSVTHDVLNEFTQKIIDLIPSKTD